jgi:hypothetical protein
VFVSQIIQNPKNISKKMKQAFLFLGALFILGTVTMAQEKTIVKDNGFAVYGNTASAIGLEYQINQMFAVGIRMDQGIVDEQSLTPLVTAVIKETSDASVYLGLGLKGLAPFGDISIPLGVRVFPFNEKKLAFSVELESIVADDFFVRPSIGIVYRFRK